MGDLGNADGDVFKAPGGAQQGDDHHHPGQQKKGVAINRKQGRFLGIKAEGGACADHQYGTKDGGVGTVYPFAEYEDIGTEQHRNGNPHLQGESRCRIHHKC